MKAPDKTTNLGRSNITNEEVTEGRQDVAMEVCPLVCPVRHVEGTTAFQPSIGRLLKRDVEERYWPSSPAVRLLEHAEGLLGLVLVTGVCGSRGPPLVRVLVPDEVDAAPVDQARVGDGHAMDTCRCLRVHPGEFNFAAM